MEYDEIEVLDEPMTKVYIRKKLKKGVLYILKPNCLKWFRFDGNKNLYFDCVECGTNMVIKKENDLVGIKDVSNLDVGNHRIKTYANDGRGNQNGMLSAVCNDCLKDKNKFTNKVFNRLVIENL